MTRPISRREFLKLSLLTLGALAFNPFPVPAGERNYPSGMLGRVTVSNRVTVYREPDWNSPVVGYLNVKDQLIQLYYEIQSESGPAYNPLWYRVWGGFIHCAYIQRVRFNFNQILPGLPEIGHLCEVSVPYSQAYSYNQYRGWEKLYRLYYETTHRVIGLEKGPDGKTWYRIFGTNGAEYMAPAEHLRPIPAAEMAPVAMDVPPELKRIEVNTTTQQLTAYQDKDVVLQTSVSTGLPIRPDPNGIPWETPIGTFYIFEKRPSTHMGDGRLTGDPEAYELPGVPWTMYFTTDGVAFHGAYWHNNFGMQMSHGCINMRPPEARWLFRWATPELPLPPPEGGSWIKRGRGTRVDVVS